MTSPARTSTPGAPQVVGRISWPGLQGLFGFDPASRFGGNWQLEFDVTRTERGYELEIPVPGFKPEQIEITFKDDVLAINGKNDRRSFSRSFSVPEDVDAQSIQAKVADGLLTINLDRQPEAQPRRITVTGPTQSAN